MSSNEIVRILETLCLKMNCSLDVVAFFRSDSAANMAGKRNGVGIQLQKKYQIYPLLCHAHGIMLASTHFMKSVEGSRVKRGLFSFSFFSFFRIW
jgi:hypothetical protein